MLGHRSVTLSYLQSSSTRHGEPTVAQYLVLVFGAGPVKLRVSGTPERKQSISRKRGIGVGVCANPEAGVFAEVRGRRWVRSGKRMVRKLYGLVCCEVTWIGDLLLKVHVFELKSQTTGALEW